MRDCRPLRPCIVTLQCPQAVTCPGAASAGAVSPPITPLLWFDALQLAQTLNIGGRVAQWANAGSLSLNLETRTLAGHGPYLRLDASSCRPHVGLAREAYQTGEYMTLTGTLSLPDEAPKLAGSSKGLTIALNARLNTDWWEVNRFGVDERVLTCGNSMTDSYFTIGRSGGDNTLEISWVNNGDPSLYKWKGGSISGGWEASLYIFRLTTKAPFVSLYTRSGFTTLTRVSAGADMLALPRNMAQCSLGHGLSDAQRDLDGDIRELVVYGEALSDSALAAEFSRLSVKWGVVPPPPPPAPPSPPPSPPSPPRPPPPYTVVSSAWNNLLGPCRCRGCFENSDAT